MVNGIVQFVQKTQGAAVQFLWKVVRLNHQTTFERLNNFDGKIKQSCSNKFYKTIDIFFIKRKFQNY